MLAAVLSERETQLVSQCLRASVEGTFFDEEEFHTLFGLGRSEVKQVLEDWPKETLPPDLTRNAVIGAVNNLLGYPHGDPRQLKRLVAATPEELERLLAKLVETKR